MHPKRILASVALIIVAGAPAKAQVVLDLSLITCKQYLASDPERQELIGSWLSGYFSASKNLNMLDFRYVERNQKVVGGYCKTHKNETLMSAIQQKAK